MYSSEGFLYKLINKVLREKDLTEFKKIKYYYICLLAAFEYCSSSANKQILTDEGIPSNIKDDIINNKKIFIYRGTIISDKEIKSSYERNTGRVILETFNSKDSKAIPAVLVHSHGPFTWGANWRSAIENAQALEYCAHIALQALKINPKTLKISKTLHNKHYSRKHGPHSYYGQKLDRP
jgi:hypothetical protein